MALSDDLYLLLVAGALKEGLLKAPVRLGMVQDEVIKASPLEYALAHTPIPHNTYHLILSHSILSYLMPSYPFIP